MSGSNFAPTPMPDRRKTFKASLESNPRQVCLKLIHNAFLLMERQLFLQISRNGNVKMCDFGISGYLVDSVAKTIDAGCKPYMAVKTSNLG